MATYLYHAKVYPLTCLLQRLPHIIGRNMRYDRNAFRSDVDGDTGIPALSALIIAAWTPFESTER